MKGELSYGRQDCRIIRTICDRNSFFQEEID